MDEIVLRARGALVGNWIRAYRRAAPVSECSGTSHRFRSPRSGATHKKKPEANAALGYDALHIFANAARRAGNLDRKAIRDQIAATKDYQGVSGTISMGADRNPIKPVAMIKIENGQMNFAGWVKP